MNNFVDCLSRQIISHKLMAITYHQQKLQIGKRNEYKKHTELEQGNTTGLT
jgi:hypothetical protein